MCPKPVAFFKSCFPVGRVVTVLSIVIFYSIPSPKQYILNFKCLKLISLIVKYLSCKVQGEISTQI